MMANGNCHHTSTVKLNIVTQISGSLHTYLRHNVVSASWCRLDVCSIAQRTVAPVPSWGPDLFLPSHLSAQRQWKWWPQGSLVRVPGRSLRVGALIGWAFGVAFAFNSSRQSDSVIVLADWLAGCLASWLPVCRMCRTCRMCRMSVLLTAWLAVLSAACAAARPPRSRRGRSRSSCLRATAQDGTLPSELWPKACWGRGTRSSFAPRPAGPR